MNQTLNQANTTLPVAVSNATSDLIAVQVDLTKVRIFLADTHSDLFEKYANPTKRDTETFAFMWYSLQRHESYILAALDYLDSVADKLERTCENLEEVHDQLKDMGERLEGGGKDE